MTAGPLTYCFDTSALIGAYVRSYPPEAFPGLWVKFEELIAAHRASAPVEVWNELKGRGDDLTAWAKARQHIFVKSYNLELAFLGSVGQRYPELTKTLQVSTSADPWVVAVAKARSYTVVSQEEGMSASIPKIPHMSLKEFILEEKWVFVHRDQ